MDWGYIWEVESTELSGGLYVAHQRKDQSSLLHYWLGHWVDGDAI